ncbi:MAG: hypothetical protein ACI4BI_00720 [Anaerotardibacter sp.]
MGAAEQEILEDAFAAKIEKILSPDSKLTDVEKNLRAALQYPNTEITKSEVVINAKELEEDAVPSGDVSSINNELKKNEVVAAYFDLSVNMLVEVTYREGDDYLIFSPSAIEIDSLPGPITFKLKVDPALIAGKKVRIAHVHNGKTEFIEPESVDFENGIITFKAQTFSTYAVLTSDKSNSDGEEIPGDTEEPTNPNQPGSSNDSGTTTDNKSSNKSGKNLAETGDATGNMVIGMSVLAFISAAACVTMVVRRRVRQK